MAVLRSALTMAIAYEIARQQHGLSSLTRAQFLTALRRAVVNGPATLQDIVEKCNELS